MDNEDNEATLDDLVSALGGNQNTENGQRLQKILMLKRL